MRRLLEYLWGLIMAVRLRLRGSPAVAPVSDITLSANSIAENASANTVVGQLSNNLGISVTYAVTDNSDFTVSDGGVGTTVNLIRSGTGTLTEGVSESVTIRATAPGASAYDENFSITVTAAGADTPLGVITVTETSGGTKTNEIASIGFPLNDTALDTQPYLRLWTATGSVGSDTPNAVVNAYQVDYDSTDPTTAKRWARLTFVIPSLTANATVRFVVCASDTAPPTGTAITASDITTAETSCDIAYDIAGTSYSVTTDTIFGAGTDVFSKTAARVISASAGPFRTTLYGDAPPKNAGTSHASGDGLRTCVVGEFFKVGTAAVGGGNPITLGYIDIWTDNGDVERASPANYYYGLNIRRPTSLSDATLINSDDTDPDGNVIRYAYARSQPAVTLTATGFTSAASYQTWTIPSGAWAADILGAHIIGDGGAAVVITRNSNTSIEVYVYDASASLTSLTSGNWTIEGIGHAYGAPVTKRRVWIGNKPTHVAVWGSLSSAVTATTNAPLAYLASTQLGLNYQATTADVTHTMTALDGMRGTDGSRRPLTFRGPTAVNMGDINTAIGASGDADNIGPLPRSAVNGLAKWDANGRRKIFENAEYWSTIDYHIPARYSGSPSAGELGVTPRADNGTAYKWNNAISGGQLINPASPRFWPFDGDNAHHGAYFYVPWLLTGDLYWLIMQQRHFEYYGKVVLNPGYSGAGNDCTVWGDATGVLTEVGNNASTRMKAWCDRDATYTAIMTPDSISAKIVNAKSYLNTRNTKFMAAAKAYGPDDVLNQYSGAEEGWQNPGRTSFLYGAADAILGGTNFSESGFMLKFANIAMGIRRELNMTGADGDAFMTWLSYHIRDCGSDSGLVPDLMTNLYWVFMYDGNTFTTKPADAAGIYKNNCLIGAINTSGPPGAGFRRTPSGAITMSAASIGSARTITFASGYFDVGDTWYVGGYVYETTSGGVFKITSVNAAGTVLTGDVLIAFSGTSLTAANVRIPGPHPGDYIGDFENAANDGTGGQYSQFYKAACCVQKDAGNSAATMAANITYMEGRTGYVEAENHFNIAART